MCYRGTVIRKLWELNSSNAEKIRVQFVACSLNARNILDYVFNWLQFGEVCSKNQWKSLVNHAFGFFENSCREILV